MCQQCFCLCRADAVDGFKRRGFHRLVLGTHHARYGIAVHLFLNFIDIDKHRLLPRDVDFIVTVRQCARLVELVLDHTEYRNVKPQLVHQFLYGRDMTFAAVQQNQIGRRFAKAGAGRIQNVIEPSAQCFLHRRIVIGRTGRFSDGKGSIILFDEFAVFADDHAGCDMLRTEVGNIIRFNAFWNDLQSQHRCELVKCLCIALRFMPVLLCVLLSIVRCHLAELPSVAALRNPHSDLPSGFPRQKRCKRCNFFLSRIKAEEHLTRNELAHGIELRQKRGDIFVFHNLIRTEAEMLGVDQTSAADIEDRNARAGIAAVDTDNVLFGIGGRNHLLLLPQL